MRGIWAVPVAAVVCVAAPAFADAQSHVQAAKKAERRHEWRKALSAWKAAYKAELNAEYLIGIGDAYSHLGNLEEARKNYQAYLSDPLALPGNVEKVKAKIAALDAPAGLPLPGGPALALPAEAPAQSPGLELPAAPAPKKGKKNTAVADANAPLPLPGLDLPTAKDEPDKVASAAPLELPGLPLPGEKPAEKKPAPAAAPVPPGTQVAMATPKAEPHRAPDAAVTTQQVPHTRAESGSRKTLAWVAAGVAVAGLGTGALFFSQANSAHSDLTGSMHSSADAASLLDKEKSNRTLSFVGLAAGLVSAGVATALFAF